MIETDRSDVAAAKAALRRRLLAARAARSPEERAATAAALVRAGEGLPGLEGARTVCAYAPAADEPDVEPLVGALQRRGVVVLLPVLLDDHGLDWADAAGGRVAGRYGLREPAGPRLGADAPARADLVLVPALAVDRRGNRLGRGGGSYDRALAAVGGVPVLAVVHDDEVLEGLPVEPHDRPVTGALTPGGVLRFR